MTWVAIILGPEGTPFENGTFSLILTFDENYPQHPPSVNFVSEMFHPNIYSNGDLCLDLLKSKWSPSYDVLAILLSIQSLLNDPNIKSPANVEAAKLLEKDPNEYNKSVMATVEKSWSDVDKLYDNLE